MKKKTKFIKLFLTSLASLAGVVLILGIVFVGGVKAKQLLSPYLGNVPKNRQELTQAEVNVLGIAEEAIKSQDPGKILGLGTKFIESSSLAEPIRELRETIEKRIYETIESVKSLPAREIQTVKREVCKQWGEDISQNSSPSASP